MGAKIDIELEEVRRAVLRTVLEIERVLAQADRQMAGLTGRTQRGIFGGSPAGVSVDAHLNATIGLVEQLVASVGQAATGMTSAALVATRNIENAEQASADDLALATRSVREATRSAGDLTYSGPRPAQAAAAPGEQGA
jgi:hypothetical protein